MDEVRQKNFLHAIAQAIEQGDKSLLDTSILEAPDLCFNEITMEPGLFPEAVFEQLVLLMSKQEFFDMDGSHILLLLFETEWVSLSDQQKEQLLEVFRNYYDRFKDWMSYFVISELLGEYYCNEAAFRVLTELQTTSNETARSLVPHGYEHIARDAESAALRKMALDRLASMAKDDSPDVRREVAEALTNISVHQKK